MPLVVRHRGVMIDPGRAELVLVNTRREKGEYALKPIPRKGREKAGPLGRAFVVRSKERVGVTV